MHRVRSQCHNDEHAEQTDIEDLARAEDVERYRADCHEDPECLDDEELWGVLYMEEEPLDLFVVSLDILNVER